MMAIIFVSIMTAVMINDLASKVVPMAANSTVLITGASTGIGATYADRFGELQMAFLAAGLGRKPQDRLGWISVSPLTSRKASKRT